MIMSIELGKPVKEIVQVFHDLLRDAQELWRDFAKPPTRFVRLNVQRVITATSAAFVGVVLLAAAFFNPTAVGEGLVIVLRTVTMWGVFTIPVFGFARMLGGTGTLSQTLAVVFKVMPLAYVAGTIGAVITGIFVQSYSGDWRFIMSAAAFNAVQFAVIGMFLPSCVAALHRLGRYGAAAMYVIPLVVLAINVQFGVIPKLKAEQTNKVEKLALYDSKLPIYWPPLTYQGNLSLG
jgi:hypothetical protein